MENSRRVLINDKAVDGFIFENNQNTLSSCVTFTPKTEVTFYCISLKNTNNYVFSLFYLHT